MQRHFDLSGDSGSWCPRWQCIFPFLFPTAAHSWYKHARTGHPLLVGYFPQRGLNYDQPYSVKQLVDNGGAALLDQINYAQGLVSDGECSVADPHADLNTTYTAENSVSGKPDHPASRCVAISISSRN